MNKLKIFSNFCTDKGKSLISLSNFFIWVLMLLQLLLNKSLIVLAIPLVLIPSIVFFMSNFNIQDNDEKKKYVRLYVGGWTPSIPIVLNCIILSISPKLSFPGGLEIPLGRLLAIVTDIIVVALLIYLTHRPIMKVKLQKLGDFNLLNKLHINLTSVEASKGDIVLCKNKESKQKVIIPCKDRFLHMLVLGPTGSGKTSQIILPMLNQDLQNKDAGVTVIEPKGDLAEKAYAMAQHYGRKAIYFNPILESCPTFNPLYGKEEDVIENIVTAFKMLNTDSAQYFQDMNEQLLRNALKVLKRTKGNHATMIDLSRLISNTGGSGRKLVQGEFNSMEAPTDAIAKENEDIANYLLSDYFNEKSKSFENTSGVRSQVAKIVSNKFLRKVLNPQGKSDIDFDHHLEEGTVICISTAQGKLRDLGRFLGYFIILNFQSATFKRPGNENTRRNHFLYIDEFQSYSNPGFADMLTQGRSYRVASHLATQNRALIGMGSGKDGDDFVELVSTNARNIILFPGGNFNDAKYYSEQFGEIDKITIGESSSRAAMNPLMLSKAQGEKDTFQIKEETEARMSPTDIILRPFGEITYSIVQSNTLQPAGIGLISYIDRDLNTKLDKMVEENNIMMTMGVDPNKFKDFNNQEEMSDRLDWDSVKREYEAKVAQEKADAIGTQDDMLEDTEKSKYEKGYKENQDVHSIPKKEDIPKNNTYSAEQKTTSYEDIITIPEDPPKQKKITKIDDDFDDLI
jgi:type IV secretory pathway TraG/TraD family ATPase VirD4